MNNQRGTSSFSSDNSVKWWFRKKNQVTRFSSLDEGQKITINKGTKTIQIIKNPIVGIPIYHKILVVNRGTQRLDLGSKNQRN